MVTKLTVLAAAVLSVALAGTAARTTAARTIATPGVSAKEIVIGGTVPLSGEAAAAANVAKGADAYFKYVNAHGGVNGRSITYKYVDDGYDPSRTVQAVRELVQSDQVFALFGTLGTSQNLAIRDFLNASGVPQLYANSGATTFGADHKRYPWTIGYIPTYKAEGEIYARTILKTLPKAKIGVLYQNDDYGKDLLNGLRRGLGKRASMIVERGGVRADGDRRPVPDREPEGLGRERALHLRVRQVLGAGVQLRRPARLEAEDLRQRRLRGRAADDLRAEAGGRGDDVDRLPQGPRLVEVGEGSGDEAVQVDPRPLRQGRGLHRRLLHGRDGLGVHARRHAPQGGQEPHPGRRDEGGDEPQRGRTTRSCFRGSR